MLAKGQELSANGHAPKACMKAILSTRALNALCKLLSDYNAQRDNRATLAELKDVLGTQLYADFQTDLRQLMNRMTAKKAVSTIITAAVQRKKDAELAR